CRARKFSWQQFDNLQHHGKQHRPCIHVQATDGAIQHSTNHQNDAGDHQSLEQSNVICVCFLTRLLQVYFVPLDPHELTLTVKPNEPLFAVLCHSTQDT